MANLTDWIPNITKHIPNIPAPDINNAVRDACRKFCVETWIWKNTLALINVVASTSAYDLTIPAALYAELVAVPNDGVRYKQNGEATTQFSPLTCTSEDELDAESGNWRYETSPQPTRFYVDNIDKKVNLVYTPEDASASGLEVSVILKPSKTALTVPDFLHDDYEDVIEAGALEDLLNRKNRSFYDPQEAGRHGSRFRAGYNEAKMKRFTGATNKPMSIKMRFFA